jgi:DNA-directed RNA polymerase specialized sigma24 family protein
MPVRVSLLGEQSIVDSPAGTVRTRVHYGLRRLRCVLETADAAA